MVLTVCFILIVWVAHTLPMENQSIWWFIHLKEVLSHGASNIQTTLTKRWVINVKKHHGFYREHDFIEPNTWVVENAFSQLKTLFNFIRQKKIGLNIFLLLHYFLSQKLNGFFNTITLCRQLFHNDNVFSACSQQISIDKRYGNERVNYFFLV